MLNIFKGLWQRSQTRDQRRRKLFWYLKRKTSYTAWLRASRAFDAFVEVAKRQVAEQPRAAGGIFGGTDWKAHFKDIVKAQTLFHEGLARLLQGDRSVLLYTEFGLLRQAFGLSIPWYAELTFGGERYDHEFYGDYLNDMKVEINRFNEACRDIGYIESSMTSARIPLFWGEYIECILDNEAFPRGPVDGRVPERYAAQLLYPLPLPAIAPASIYLRVATGELVERDGIYEPIVFNPCLNYLSKNTLAPPLGVEGGFSVGVEWKLVWEDTRYADGQVPSEENCYFP